MHYTLHDLGRAQASNEWHAWPETQSLTLVCTVAWGGAGDCRYFLDNERFVLSDTAPAPAKKLFVWDRWSDAVHVIGEYLPQVPPCQPLCGSLPAATSLKCHRNFGIPACTVRWTTSQQSETTLPVAKLPDAGWIAGDHHSIQPFTLMRAPAAGSHISPWWCRPRVSPYSHACTDGRPGLLAQWPAAAVVPQRAPGGLRLNARRPGLAGAVQGSGDTPIWLPSACSCGGPPLYWLRTSPEQTHGLCQPACPRTCTCCCDKQCRLTAVACAT